MYTCRISIPYGSASNLGVTMLAMIFSPFPSRSIVQPVDWHAPVLSADSVDEEPRGKVGIASPSNQNAVIDDVVVSLVHYR